MDDRQIFGHLFTIYVVVAAVVFVAVCALLAFALVHYRAGRGHEPSQKSQHRIGEPLYACGLAIVATLLAVLAARADASEQTPATAHPRISVLITAYQWCWSFHYEGTKVTERASCDGSLPVLVVPKGETVGFALTSEDVIHEWWLPMMRFKEEAFPGHVNHFQLRFPSTGEWEGRCDEFCGLYHDRMEFLVKVETPKAFSSWLGSAKRAST